MEHTDPVPGGIVLLREPPPPGEVDAGVLRADLRQGEHVRHRNGAQSPLVVPDPADLLPEALQRRVGEVRLSLRYAPVPELPAGDQLLDLEDGLLPVQGAGLCPYKVASPHLQLTAKLLYHSLGTVESDAGTRGDVLRKPRHHLVHGEDQVGRSGVQDAVEVDVLTAVDSVQVRVGVAEAVLNEGGDILPPLHQVHHPALGQEFRRLVRYGLGTPAPGPGLHGADGPVPAPQPVHLLGDEQVLRSPAHEGEAHQGKHQR